MTRYRWEVEVWGAAVISLIRGMLKLEQPRPWWVKCFMCGTKVRYGGTSPYPTQQLLGPSKATLIVLPWEGYPGYRVLCRKHDDEVARQVRGMVRWFAAEAGVRCGD